MILIVDDKQENIFSLKTLLEINKFEVDTALSGEEALKKVLKNTYALIILDVQMPDMDGFEVAEAISGNKKTRETPIIFLSAVNTEKRFITKGYTSGGIDYLVKPFDPDILLLKVHTLCRLFEQTQELNRIQKSLKEEIEERKKIERELERRVDERTLELQQSNKELETANNELRQFAWIASHDLQEPVRKIKVFSLIIKEKFGITDDKVTSYLDKVILSSERMMKLIQDLLNYTELSNTQKSTMVNLNKVVEEVLVDFELLIKEKNAKINVGKLPDLEIVKIEAVQIFQNIINNALKYAKTSVPAEITINSEEISVAGKNGQEKKYCRITISDNGIGFDEAYINKIFNMFQRLHGKGEYEGTGIGLAIVKKIIEKHNGTITAKSSENNGASFIITLPFCKN
ncbi:MAG TPA: response regulator [Chitinophagaceae bacterium]|nr:response regulator [Chitinophagaceae bacterium]